MRTAEILLQLPPAAMSELQKQLVRDGFDRLGVTVQGPMTYRVYASCEVSDVGGSDD